MRLNTEDAVRRLWCVVITAGAALVLLSGARAGAQTQSTEQKPADSYQAFYLTNSTGQHDANDIQTALRNMLSRAKLFYTGSGNAILIRGSAEDIALAQKILADIDRPRKTYRLTYTINEGGISQGGAQHFVLLVTPGSKTSMKQGSRVPIMTGSYGTGSDQNTQVQYLDVGVNLEATLEGYGDGMRLRTKIEESSVADEKSNVGIQDPVIRQSVLESETAVTAGKPVVLGSVEMPGSGKHLEVSVVAEVVK
jgi:type II secretory pathway component GspD/PulD (secretin)